MPLLWKADGSSEVVVVFHRKKKKNVEKRWTNINGIWWYEAPTSKYTTKLMYPEIIRFFASRGEAVVYIDNSSRPPEIRPGALTWPLDTRKMLQTCGSQQLVANDSASQPAARD